LGIPFEKKEQRMSRLAVLLLSFWLAVPAAAWSDVSVTTWHNDLARTGQNLAETKLTPAGLRAGGFEKRCARSVDGQIYAQPLYLPRLKLGAGARDVVFVATEHDSVYAFDADCRGRAPLWKTSFLSRGVTTMPCTSRSQTQCDTTILSPERGITATPVIDRGRGAIYVAAQSVEHGVYTQKLHALDLRTGAELADSPATIVALAPDNAKKKFDAAQGFQRSGLLLLGGVVYIPFASNDSASGWMIGYDASTLAQRGVFCVTPTGNLGGIWSGGAAPAVDAAGAIYVATGNGAFDADEGGLNFSMSTLRLAKHGGDLDVGDYFTPSREAALSKRDLDLGSGGVMLLPDQPGPHPHEAIVGFKTGTLFLLDRDNLGHTGDSRAVQHFVAFPQGIYTTAAFWGGNVYLAGVSGRLTQWRLENGMFPASAVHESANAFSYPGATPSVSSNGPSNAIVWVIGTRGRVQGGPPAVLRAYDANDVSLELYASDAAGSNDAAGPAVKFTVPTIADGKVFVGTQTELDIFGLSR
jgi:outer membrane protein assembly factor BamB